MCDCGKGCHTPAEVAALVAAGQEAMRDQEIEGILDALSSDAPICCDGRDCGCRGSMLADEAAHCYPKAAAALARLIAEARREGMQEMLRLARSYQPIEFSSGGVEIPGAMRGATSAKNVIVETLAALIEHEDEDAAIRAAAGEGQGADRACTCHPSEAPKPCQKQYALSDCTAAIRAAAGEIKG
jgi:hypothetical protein